MAGLPRDPVSVGFDGTARRLLERAYRQRGTWVSVRLTDPTIRDRTRHAGIDLDGPDNASTAGGRGLNARTRWARALVRSVNFVNKHEFRGAPITFEVGRHIPASPQFDPHNPRAGGFPPSRQFRMQVRAGGQAAMKAVKRLSDQDRIFDDDGRPAARYSDPALRDWI